MTPDAPDRFIESSGGPSAASIGPALQNPIIPSLPTIPDHQLLKKIGGGSYGEVWLARNVLGGYRAIKIIYRQGFDHDRPFEREFEGIQKFEPISRAHPRQLDILHVGRNEQAGYFYYVMELADDAGEKPKTEIRDPKEIRTPNVETLKPNGPARDSGFGIRNSELYTPRTLKLDLQRRGRLPVDECITIGLSLTTALAHLHEHGLIHRDVKPSNIVFVNGVPKLADIGLVTDIEATRSFVGTEGFIPPEGPGTVQADLYSLGKVLYEMSMGRSRLDFPALPANWDDLSQDEQKRLLEINEVLLKSCESDVSKRYASAEQMQAELVLLQRGQSVKHKHALQRRWALAKRGGVVVTALVAAVALLSLVAVQISRRVRPSGEAMQSIGVLPFACEIADQRDIYLGESLAEELIRGLAKIRGIRVVAPNSSFKFKDTSVSSQKIIDQLRVAHLLRGTIRKSGELMTIGANLTNPKGERTWSKTYDCQLTELPLLEREMAQAVAEALTGSHGNESRAHLATLPTQNTEAYKFYWEGTYWLHRWSESTIDPAIDLLEKAVALDPKFAAAHAALAQAYVQKAFTFDTLPSWQAKASAAIQAALRFDPNCAEAYLARGKFLWSPWNRFQHELAIKDWRRALELDASLADAYQNLAMVYVHLGLFDPARTASRQALELDPLNPGALYREGVANLYDGRYQEALSVFERVPPSHQSALLTMQTATALFYLRRTNEANVHLEKLLNENPDDALAHSTLAILFSAGDDAERAKLEIGRATKNEQGSLGHFHHVSYNVGCAFSLLKNNSAAVQWLKKSADEGYPCYPRFEKDPLLDHIRSDPQFQELVGELQKRFEQYKRSL